MRPSDGATILYVPFDSERNSKFPTESENTSLTIPPVLSSSTTRRRCSGGLPEGMKILPRMVCETPRPGLLGLFAPPCASDCAALADRAMNRERACGKAPQRKVARLAITRLLVVTGKLRETVR